DRRWSPVSLAVPQERITWGKEEDQALAFTDGAGLVYPVQVERSADPAAGATLTWIVPHLARGERKLLRLGRRDQPAAGVNLRPNSGDAIDVEVNGRLFTRYNYSRQWSRPFLYPVIGPGGAGVTRNYPMVQDVADERRDHPHHRSIYFTHGDV